jgi:hypothetical protein
MLFSGFAAAGFSVTWHRRIGGSNTALQKGHRGFHGQSKAVPNTALQKGHRGFHYQSKAVPNTRTPKNTKAAIGHLHLAILAYNATWLVLGS